MLGKLMKHEWKNIYKVGCMMLLIIMTVTAIGCIVLQLPATTALFDAETNLSDMQRLGWSMMGTLSLLVYVFMLVGATYGMFIFLGLRFYRTMYTDQGYLTNTLPVTSNQLLASKILVSGIWYMVIEIAVIVSVVALIASLLNGLLAEELASEGFRSIWDVLVYAFAELEPFYAEIGLDLVRYGITFLIVMLIGPFATMTVLFGSLTLGQLSKKHKGIMGIVAYLGVTFINMIASSIAQVINSIGFSKEVIRSQYSDTVMELEMNSALDVSSIVTLMVAIILYIVSYQILSKKLNMD